MKRKTKLVHASGEAPVIEVRRITDLLQDTHNANSGTERGLAMLDGSVQDVGIGRGVVADRAGRLIGGNKTQLAAVEHGFDEAIFVHTKGDQLVVTVRDDLDFESDDPEIRRRTREAAYLDNRVGEINLNWDKAEIARDASDGLNFSKMWTTEEMAELFADGDVSDGTMLRLANIAIADPVHAVEVGQHWLLGKRHRLICGDVLRDWSMWKPHLKGANLLFVPYPGPFAPLTIRADGAKLLMVQPDAYICGHILDRYAEIYGEESVVRD